MSGRGAAKLRGMALGPLVRLFDGRPLTRLALVSEVRAASTDAGVGSCPLVLVLLRAQLLNWSCDLLWQDGLGCMSGRGAAKLLGEAWADISHFVDGRPPLTRLALVSEVRAVAGVDPVHYAGHSFWIGCGNRGRCHQDTWPLAQSVRLAPTGSLRSHHRTTGIQLSIIAYAVSYIICEKATSQNQIS